MDLEMVIQITASKKNKYMLMHACGNWKNGRDELAWNTVVERQMQRTSEWTPRGEGVGWDELGLTYVHVDTVYRQITNEYLLYSTEDSVPCGGTRDIRIRVANSLWCTAETNTINTNKSL